MAFERFIPPKIVAARPKATIRPSGLVSFDAAAVEAFRLDKSSHAVLFFDKGRKLVGVKPTNNGNEDGALPLSRRRRSVSLKSPYFFDSCAISLPRPQRFDVAYDDRDGMMLISVKSVQRKRGRRPQR